MDISSKKRQVLIDLFSSPRGLYAYTLYGRYGLSPSDALSFIEEYQKKEAIHVDEDNRIVLTKDGRKQIVSLVHSSTSITGKENSFLSRFRTDAQIEINAPYLPNELFYIKCLEREAEKTSQ